MRTLALVLICLACSGLGRRVQKQSEPEESQKSTMAALANLLASRHPESAFQAPAAVSSQPATKTRADPQMYGKRIIAINGIKNDEPFEVREMTVGLAPVKILKRIGELQLVTKLADAGLLSAAERAGVFSKLEEAGAFSTAEKLLPVIEKSGLLGIIEGSLDIEGTTWRTLGQYIIFAPIFYWILCICSFQPIPQDLDFVKFIVILVLCQVSGWTLEFWGSFVQELQECTNDVGR